MNYPKKYRFIAGNNGGAFRVPFKKGGKVISLLHVIASHIYEWDHVSVSLESRCPTWEEMCFIKDLFFGPDECVIQYHPPKSEYIDHCKTCLHLWRPHNQEIPKPPKWMV